MSAPTDAELVSVATYRRTIHASTKRIWENVLDWEHLPWLHRSSFSSAEWLGEPDGAEGWRIHVRTAPAPGAEMELEARLDRPNLEYTVWTTAGAGEGSATRTRMEPIDPSRTRIAVEFRVPGVPALPPGRADAMGRAYVRLYTRLWDEDEAMMGRRQTLLDAGRARSGGRAGAPIALGAVEALRAALPRVWDVDGDEVRVVEHDGKLVAHSTRCPHLGGPLDACATDDGVIECPWHGYRFDLRSGRSCDGRDLAFARSYAVRVDDAGVAVLTRAEPGRAKR